jgi:hypothetical protein
VNLSLASGVTAVRFSPVHGSISARSLPFDLHVLVGVGVIGTVDDMDALRCDGQSQDPCAQTATQVHMSSLLGAGVRLGVSRRVATRLEVRKVIWVEVVNGTHLQTVSPLLVQASTTIALGR